MYLTPEERKQAEKAIFLPMVRNVLERDLQQLPVKLRKPYEQVIHRALDNLSKELPVGMKIHKAKETDYAIEWHVWLHGNKEVMRYTRVRIRDIVEAEMRRLLNGGV